MKLRLNRARISSLLEEEKLPHTEVREVTTLEDIPEFMTAEEESRFWRSHTISKELLDQIPHDLEPDR